MMGETRSDLETRFIRAIEAMDLNIDEAAQGKMLAYLALMQKWNKTYNLTAIHDPARMLSHHLLDSLAVLPWIKPGNLLDVGSGAGLPGIPLAIALPELQVTLVEANQKKCAFMQHAAIELKLENVQVENARVESVQSARGFDQIISRAFSSLVDFTSLTRHLLAPGGVWLAMKGLLPSEEIGVLEVARVGQEVKLEIPGMDEERHLLILEAV